MREPFLHSFRLSAVGDRVLLIELGEDASPETALRVRIVSDDLLASPIRGVLDVVPAVCSVALHYDPRVVSVAGALHGDAGAQAASEAPMPYASLSEQVIERLKSLDPKALPEPEVVEIPVCYGGELGEDLEALARAHGLPAGEVIALHSAPLYRVQMIGFAPGFAYLAGLDPRLATPRRATPRTRVPAGSVGIGGELTGVYPFELPGGWNLIGRSPLRLFTPERDPPSRLALGDRVRFVPIDPDHYAQLMREQR